MRGVGGFDEGEAVGGEAVAGGVEGPGSEEGDVGEFPDESWLDRSQPCLLDDSSDCGYPAGPYGFSTGLVLSNFEAFDCDGNVHEIAELLNVRPDTGSYNRGVVMQLMAGWAVPGLVLAEDLVDRVDVYRMDQIENFALLIEGTRPGSAPTAEECQAVEDSIGAAYPVWFVTDWAVIGAIKSPIEPFPFLRVLDANANLRTELQGTFGLSSIDTLVEDIVEWPYG